MHTDHASSSACTCFWTTQVSPFSQHQQTATALGRIHSETYTAGLQYDTQAHVIPFCLTKIQIYICCHVGSQLLAAVHHWAGATLCAWRPGMYEACNLSHIHEKDQAIPVHLHLRCLTKNVPESMMLASHVASRCMLRHVLHTHTHTCIQTHFEMNPQDSFTQSLSHSLFPQIT
jgi:hypothetical protein